MSADIAIREGQVLTGPLFNEPMRVETVRPNGPDSVEAGLVGQRTERFRRVTLTSSDIADLTVADTTWPYDGDGSLLKLGLQAYSLGIAHEFDPYFGLSISRVDPLPHQLEAVYEYFMKLPSVRFLLADDAGAGKTIMAGLLIRELKLRGLAERVLIVCPANLTFQWQRELKEKFDQQFFVLKGGDIRDQFGVNQWHPLFEALRRHSLELAQDPFTKGACFHSLDHDVPARLDFYRARVVDGLGQVIHERLFTVELADGREPLLRQPDILGNLTPAAADGPALRGIHARS